MPNRLAPFILDCDTGRDDALTLWICSKLDLPLVAVMSSYGNVPVDQVCINNNQVLSLSGDAHIPVFRGASHPAKEHMAYKNVVLERQKSVGNGLSDVVLPTTDKSIEHMDFIDWLKGYVRDHGKINYVVIGPATNVSNLVDILGKDFHLYIDKVTMMGGKFSPLWEELPGADFNILADPYAIHAILEQGVEINFVPMNATYPIAIHLDDIKNLRPIDEIGTVAKDIMLSHVEKFSPEPFFRFHDPLVPFVMSKAEFFKKEYVGVNIEENSSDFGRMVRDRSENAVHILELSQEQQSHYLKSILGVFFES